MTKQYIFKNFLFSSLMGFGVVSACFAQTTPATFDTDFQIWNETHFIFPLTKEKDWSAAISVFGRFGNNVKTVTDSRIGLSITKRFNKYVTISGGYLYRYSNATFTRKRYESRYMGTATFTVPLDKKWTAGIRHIYQYEDRYSRANASVIRDRLLLKREVTVMKKKIEPFVSFEPTYDFRLRGFARYRTQIGFSQKINSQLSADFFYIRQEETGNGSRPGTLNGIGSNFRVNL